MDGIAAARRFFAGCFAECDPRVEHLWIAHLDRSSRCIELVRYDGEEGGVTFPIRALILDAAKHNSVGLVIAHNHPSGDPSPSATDLAITRRVSQVCAALDVLVYDHLIIAGDGWYSFRHAGLL